MTVPKCKECKHHRIYPLSWGQKDRHWCSNNKVKIYQTQDKSIEAKEITSPKWCSLRETNMEV